MFVATFVPKSSQMTAVANAVLFKVDVTILSRSSLLVAVESVVVVTTSKAAVQVTVERRRRRRRRAEDVKDQPRMLDRVTFSCVATVRFSVADSLSLGVPDAEKLRVTPTLMVLSYDGAGVSVGKKEGPGIGAKVGGMVGTGLGEKDMVGSAVGSLLVGDSVGTGVGVDEVGDAVGVGGGFKCIADTAPARFVLMYSLENPGMPTMRSGVVG